MFGLLSALVLSGSMAFWLSSAAGSFRRIVESQNKDIWHLMNALESLRGMFNLMRLIILGSIVLLVVAVVVHFFNQSS